MMNFLKRTRPLPAEILEELTELRELLKSKDQTNLAIIEKNQASNQAMFKTLQDQIDHSRNMLMEHKDNGEV